MTAVDAGLSTLAERFQCSQDPNEKLFALSAQGLARLSGAMRAEASRCVLLCSNRRAEVEGGVAQVSLH